MAFDFMCGWNRQWSYEKEKNENMLRRQKESSNIKNGGLKSKKCVALICIYEANETMYGRVWDRF